ncbi:dnaJ homolog subfamily C member 17-like [Sycon ciliatum]|uniref:dnaJ homolog subfamily C member 17-like n=1 Tax=Sycon ciliatum TaxID=27933 RepID=UPI0020AAFDEA|eukprot:scpid87871/ scgid24950/ DnaJ homolog subfamily C member 17
MPPKGLSIEDVQDEDLYAFLHVQEKATDKELESAYRKLALKWHPDKNPDNAEAADLFRKLVKVTEILKDKEARAAYDQLRRARHLQELRKKELNAERRKLREDLERREAAHSDNVVSERQAREGLAAKILRLKEEGAALVRASEQKLRDEWAQTQAEQLAAASAAAEATTAQVHAVKVRWKKSKAFAEDDIRRLLSQFGTLGDVVMSAKGGRALVEFESHSCAALAAETGCPDLTITLQSSAPADAEATPAASSPSPASHTQASSNSPLRRPPPAMFASAAASAVPPPSTAGSHNTPAFPAAKRKVTEEEVFAMMRLAQQRKDQQAADQ